MRQSSTCDLKFKADYCIIPFGLQHALKSLLLSFSAYALIATFAWLLSRAGISDNIFLSLVHIAGAVALGISWRMGRWGVARYDCFGSALLLVGIAFRIQALIDTLIYGTRYETLYRYPNIPIPDDGINLLLKSEVITVSALLLVACSWRIKVGSHVEKHAFFKNTTNIPIKISLLIYISAFLIDIARRLSGISFGPLEQAASLLFTAGVAAIYFIAVQRTSSKGKLYLSIAMGLPLSALALNSGMKEEIFFPLIPTAIIFWANFRHWPLRISALGSAVILLAFSQLYVHHVREISWTNTGDLNIPTTTLVSSFINSLRDTSIIDALDQTSSRVNMTTAHAITTTLADNNKHEPFEVFGLIPASVVPRFLWPNKPIMQPGAMHTSRILGHSGHHSELRSATAAGFGAELYLGGWWVGVVLGAIFYGWIMATAQQWTFRFGQGFAHKTVCFIALYWTIRFDEKHVIYAYTSIIFLVIFVWLLAKITAAFGIRGVTHHAVQ
jgi:hypothetical protein